jgi:SAM-dependent methyltransferase
VNVAPSFVCHTCAGTVSPLAAPALRYMAGSDCTPVSGDVRIGACPSCGLLQKDTSEAWQQLCEKIYGDYRIYHQAAGQEQKARGPGDGLLAPRSELIAGFLSAARDMPQEGCILDIGCGNGAFLRAINKAFPRWRLTGSDLNETFRAQILAIDPRASFQNRHQLESSAETFDVLSLIHCVEHIPAPVRYLAKVRRHIKPSGALLIEVPDAELNPFDMVVADHASHFSKSTLAAVVKAAGYEVIACGNVVLDKEITLLARPLHDAHAVAPQPSCDGASEYARRNLAWLEDTIARGHSLAEQSRTFGIFGTSIAGVWIKAALGEHIDFFVDEDEVRVGRRYFGIPVLAPSSVPAGATVFVCLEPKLAQAIVARHSDSIRRYIATPPLGRDRALALQ